MKFLFFLTEKCNLNCGYCFEGKKGTLSMSESQIPLIMKFIDSYMKNSIVQNNNEISINFNGGEVLLEFKLLKKMVFFFSKKGIKTFSISTNFTICSDEIIDFLNKKNISIQISIDGNKFSHNLYRYDYNKNGSFDRVVSNINYLNKKKLNISVSYSLVFTPKTVHYLYENILFLLTINISNISASYCVDYPWEKESLVEFDRQLKKICELYIKMYENKKTLRFSLLTDIIENYLEDSGKQTCGACTDQIAVTPSGKILACGTFLNCNDEEEYLIGSIYSGVNKPNMKEFISKISIENEHCLDCSLALRCSHQCYAANKRVTGSLQIIPKATCEINKRLIVQADKLLEYFIKTKNSTFFTQYSTLLFNRG